MIKVSKSLSGIVILLSFTVAALGQVITPYAYQELVCGQTLITNGYTTAQLRAAYTLNSNIPTIPDTALNKVLYRCTDNIGTVISNSFCIVGCDMIGDNTVNDMCTM
ncbi:unnamed protein product [Clonostachys chloroleuca]|uniref:Transmembrane protein n=1 Tax=Clonostachys chloroleuca TaxID=1926264 RepID=A0AA35M6B2_9HYPO|nr:unnamed protein product [Clonostachys chloroleuca]